MSWLNFNDSLNNLKGQISNFASNVLAEEDQGPELKDNDYKQLKEQCIQQEIEIQKLRQVNEELNSKQIQDASRPNGSWNWSTNGESSTSDPTESISDLRKRIVVLENEKSELVAKLVQLDAENQENLVNIMQMKEKLQYELNDLNENYLILQKENKILIENEKKLKKEVQKLKRQEDTDKIISCNEEYIRKCEELTEINQNVTNELQKLQKELDVTKNSNETLQKILEDSKNVGESSENEKVKKFENDNKLLYTELKKAKEAISFFERKSLEDEENCNKLAKILETYEKQVSSLKKEIENFSKNYEESQIKLVESEDTCKKLIREKAESKEESAILKEEIEHLKKEHLKIIDDLTNKNEGNTILEKGLESFKIENENLKKLNEDLIVKVTGIMDRDLENELADIQQEHEAQLNVLREELEQLKQKESKKTDEEITVLEKELESFKVENENLKKENEDLIVKATGRMDRDLKDMQQEHEAQLNVLRRELEQLKQNESKKIEEKIMVFEKELESFKVENENLKKLNEDLIVQATGRMDRELENELEDIQQEHEAQLNVLREELEQLKQQESKNRTDGIKFDELKEEKLLLNRELEDVKDELDELKKNHKISLQGLHDKYISIITENIKKFQECEKPSDFQHCIYEDEPQVVELSKHVENIMKILLDLKCKCGELEARALDLAEEKKNILVEKNNEIEKLIRNSDVLSQEILTNTQSLKEYENECNQMGKNNELLIAELETFKNNPVLQTISESNEDNIILLESQLENANKRIEDLEKIIDDLEKNQIRRDSLEEDNDWEKQLTDKKEDYQELLYNFDQLQIEYESLKNELEEVKERMGFVDEENEELKGSLEKLRTDYENTEYQLSELNINCEALKEEIEEYKTNFKLLLEENSNLKLQNKDNLRQHLDFESKINLLEEKLVEEENNKKTLDAQIEIMTEKLKNAKMGETSLKLQYEQKNKELAAQLEEKYNLELTLKKTNVVLSEFQNNFVELQNENDKLISQQEVIKNEAFKREETAKQLENLVNELENKLEQQNSELTTSDDYNNLKLMLDRTVLEKANLQAELSKLSQIQIQLKEATEKINVLNQQLQEITNSRNELINMVTMKHQENVTYHNEIQRLNQVVTTEVEKFKNLNEQFQQLHVKTSEEDLETKNKEIEKLTDQNNFLKEKCEVMAKNLIEEQAKSQKLLAERSEKEMTLQKKIDRLQAHLIELEEHYTQEVLQTEQKNSVLAAKVAEMEEREKNSSTMYTSVNIRANQQVESLQSQLQGVITERDSLRKQISDADDENSKQAAALANLQFVLEQFRKDKEKDVMLETERIRRHINTEKQVQEELRKEIANLKLQLEERTQGLLAASRISDQLESAKKTISGLKDEVTQLQSTLTKKEEELSDALSSTDGKVDKLLIKNLIMGFVMSNNNMNRDQTQVLKIISSVLDFNQQDHEKLKLNKPQQGWLSSILAPNPENNVSEESISKAFIQFLENESRPRVIPSLLDDTTSVPSNASSTRSTSSTSSTPRQTPIVLSEIVLPTFTEFAQNRNSSSILKDVLKDNS